MKMTGFVFIFESKRQKTERIESRLKYTCVPAIPSQFASRSYFSYNNYFVLLFFELDKVGGDNGHFRLTPTKVSTAKGIILAIKSAERVNPAALLVGHHCVAKEPRIMDLAYNF